MLPRTALELYEEMSQRDLFKPAMRQEVFDMPAVYVSIPTITTYHTPAAPLSMGIFEDARLENHSRRDRKRAG